MNLAHLIFRNGTSNRPTNRNVPIRLNWLDKNMYKAQSAEYWDRSKESDRVYMNAHSAESYHLKE